MEQGIKVSMDTKKPMMAEMKRSGFRIMPHLPMTGRKMASTVRITCQRACQGSEEEEEGGGRREEGRCGVRAGTGREGVCDGWRRWRERSGREPRRRGAAVKEKGGGGGVQERQEKDDSKRRKGSGEYRGGERPLPRTSRAREQGSRLRRGAGTQG
eukprot:756277-Hanusia_phi.AAC.2